MAWLVLEPSKPQMPGSSPSARILVLDADLGVGSVPSIQMYSALVGHWCPPLGCRRRSATRRAGGQCWQCRISCTLPDCERRANEPHIARRRFAPLPNCERRVNARRRPGATPSVTRHHGATMERAAGVRPAHRRGAGRAADPPLVHRRARPAQVVRHLPGRARDRLRRGHAVRRLGDRRLQPDPGDPTCWPGPTPTPSSSCPWATQRRARRPACSATSQNLDGTPFAGDPRQVLRRNLDRARDAGLLVLRRPRDRVLLLRRRRPVPTRRARSTRARTSTSRPPTSPATCASARSTCSRRWASRSSTRSTRTARASTRSTCATPTRSTMADNVMTLRLVVREIALERDCYATFMPKPLKGVQGSGMHTHLSLFEGDAQRLPRPRRRATAVDGRQGSSSPACCATPARSPRSPTSWSTPTSGSSAGHGSDEFEPPVYVVLGPQQPLGAGAGAGAPRPGKESSRPASSTGPPTRPATPTSPSR